MSATLLPLSLPEGVSERQVDCTSSVGLSFHILEAGRNSADQSAARPLILLVHGFPELAFSWRKVMPSLAAHGAGCHVVAVDQRGYGRTTGWDTSSFEQTDLRQFSLTGLVRDMLALVNALGHEEVRCIVGHDFGAVNSSACALMRPDFFKSCVMMSHPFKGSPRLPFNTIHEQMSSEDEHGQPDIHEALANLSIARKHYKWYNSTKPAANDWVNPAQGLHRFLRGYIHLKSADWAKNNPHPLKSWTAPELEKMPYYYIMPLHSTMPETVASLMEGEDEQATTSWLPDEDLAFYVREWTRTGFQGGLNWYRSTTDHSIMKDMLLFAGKKIEVPSVFISGAQDWGNYQEPGALERYPDVCNDFRGVKMVEGAGHWPQQEQPSRVIHEIEMFLNSL